MDEVIGTTRPSADSFPPPTNPIKVLVTATERHLFPEDGFPPKQYRNSIPCVYYCYKYIFNIN